MLPRSRACWKQEPILVRLTVEARCHMMWQQIRQLETHSGGQTHASVLTACPRVYWNKKAADVVLQRHALCTSLSKAAVSSTFIPTPHQDTAQDRCQPPSHADHWRCVLSQRRCAPCFVTLCGQQPWQGVTQVFLL